MNGSSYLRISIGFIIGILIISNPFATLQAQAIIGVVDYMKVENPQEYLEVEKSWKKIHDQRYKEGMIVGWSIYQVMFKTSEDPYNYITVSWYDSFSKLDKGVPEETLKAAFPNKTKEEWKEFNRRTEQSRKLISSGVFHQRLTCANGLDKQGLFYVINEINVKPGKSKEFINLSDDIFLPMYEEDIKKNNRTVWSLWEKWPGNMKDFQYLAADGYTSLDQIEPFHYLNYFNKIHPGKDIDEINNQMEELRELTNSEMWKLIYRIH